jgi:hypothetical protein
MPRTEIKKAISDGEKKRAGGNTCPKCGNPFFVPGESENPKHEMCNCSYCHRKYILKRW